MSLQSMMKDKVKLIKRDGQRIDNIDASVQSDRITTFNTRIALEEGDTYERTLPSGITERYMILDTGYHAGLGNIPASYQSKVRKQTHAEEQNTQARRLNHLLTKEVRPRAHENDMDEYDSLTNDVMASNYTNHTFSLKRWFFYLDNHPVFSGQVKSLIDAVDFKKWYEDGKKTMTGMVGSGTLEWPLDTKSRLGFQLSLFRSFAEEETDVGDFCSYFMYTGSRYEDMVREVNDQYFRIMARDLRKLLKSEPKQANIPASDRYVTLDHNSADYKKVIAVLTDLINKVETNNEFKVSDPEAQERTVTELNVSKALLSAKTITTGAVTFISMVFVYLVSKFADGIIGAIAGEGYQLLKTLMGI